MKVKKEEDERMYPHTLRLMTGYPRSPTVGRTDNFLKFLDKRGQKGSISSLERNSEVEEKKTTTEEQVLFH
jgi:hypothetical protein